MSNLLLVISLTILINVQVYHFQQQDEWWYDMGNDWEVSNEMAEVSLYYASQQQTAAKMATWGPARHVGKINGGKIWNAELNSPRYRAYGFQPDFNPEDLKSGAFNIQPQGQKIRANLAHVYEGFANYEGEVVTMPIGQHVQEDGSILVQVSHTTTRRGNPCQPDPCASLRMPTCTPVNRFTAKCTRTEDYKLTLSWSDPVDWDWSENDINLLLVADYHDGSLCTAISSDFLHYDDEDCGVVISADDDVYAYYDDPENAEESATLTTLADGTNYKSYTYAVIAFVNPPYNPTQASPTLTVKYNGEVKQTLTIPQYNHQEGSNLNYMDLATGEWRAYYFFGCFRPQLGYVDTRGAGFHIAGNDGAPDTTVMDGLGILSPGLCKATRSWDSGYGFNPYEQSGAGDERGDGCSIM